MFPKDTAGTTVHPDDYSHFHSISPNSLVDAATGQPNAAITLLDPNFSPAAFGLPGATSGTPNPLPAPSFIEIAGTIAAGATEKLQGLNPDGSVTLHSEDTPGPNGGSFVLAFFPTATTGTPNPNRVVLPPGLTTAAGKDYVFAGLSQNPGDLPVLQFLGGTQNMVGSFTVGSAPPAARTFGEVNEGAGASVEATNGVTVNNGVLTVSQQSGASLALDGSGRIDGGGTLTVSSTNDQEVVKLNGSLGLSAIGSNVLDLDAVKLSGAGAVIQGGESDITRVHQVSGVQFQVDDGALIIADARLFDGTIGPAPGDSNNKAIGLFGEVEVLGDALKTASATFDTSNGVLSLFDSAGQLLGGLRFSGDASGLTLNVTKGLATDYLSITDHTGGAGGSIPINFT